MDGSVGHEVSLDASLAVGILTPKERAKAIATVVNAFISISFF